jgi:hypothetical protein
MDRDIFGLTEGFNELLPQQDAPCVTLQISACVLANEMSLWVVTLCPGRQVAIVTRIYRRVCSLGYQGDQFWSSLLAKSAPLISLARRHLLRTFKGLYSNTSPMCGLRSQARFLPSDWSWIPKRDLQYTPGIPGLSSFLRLVILPRSGRR